jgi:hypothetical protein
MLQGAQGAVGRRGGKGEAAPPAGRWQRCPIVLLELIHSAPDNPMPLPLPLIAAVVAVAVGGVGSGSAIAIAGGATGGGGGVTDERSDSDPTPACAADLDAYCGNASDPGLAPCYASIRASHRETPMVAAYSGDIKHSEPIWRCYSPSDLSGGATTPLMRRHFVNHNATCTAPHCCCTAPPLRKVLARCDPSWAPPPAPPPRGPHTGVLLFGARQPAPKGGVSWTHFGNAVSLLFIPGTATGRGSSAAGTNGTLIALTLARGIASASGGTGGNHSRFQVEVPIIRRSQNGGVSWGPDIFPLGPQPQRGDRWLPMQQVYDATAGRLLLTLGNGTEPIPRALSCESHGIAQLASTDGGLHWSAAVDDISALLSGETTCLAPTGGVGIQLRKGRCACVPHVYSRRAAHCARQRSWVMGDGESLTTADQCVQPLGRPDPLGDDAKCLSR